MALIYCATFALLLLNLCLSESSAPYNFCPVLSCPTEIIAFSDRHDEFAALDAEILGVSVDSEFSHLAWIQTERTLGGIGEINYPLVSDLKRLSRLLG